MKPHYDIFYSFNEYFLDVDCRRPGACGLGAICTNNLGSYSCQCPPNTVADPDLFTQCLDILKCTGEADCPGNALSGKPVHVPRAKYWR